MAQVTVTTTAVQDAAAQRYVAEYNARQREMNPAWVDITAVQWFRQFVDERLNKLAADYSRDDTTTKIEAYRLASTDDKATIDGILAKYQ